MHVALRAAFLVLQSSTFSGGKRLLEQLLRVQAVLKANARGPLTAADSTPAALALTKRGLPCLTMANSHMYVYSADMEEWMRIADWGWPASAYHTTLNTLGEGELAGRMAAAEAARPRSMLLGSVRAVCSFALATH